MYTAIITKTDLGYANVWECRDVASGGSVTGCSQRGYVNGFDLPMNFMCPTNQYVAGVENYHDNGCEDHRWRFTSCAISNRITDSWDGPINFQANQGEVITGVFSYHRNDKE